MSPRLPTRERPSSAATPLDVVSRLDDLATRTRTSCGDGFVVWRSWGEGAPVVMLHGASGAWTHWLRNIPALAERFRVIVPDMPGYGDSAMPPEPTVESLAGVLADGLDRAAPGLLSMVGFSFGGIVAGLVAARLGDRVQRLVLIGPNGMALPHGEPPRLVRVRADMTADGIREAHRENLRLLMLGRPERADDLAVFLQAENIRRARFKSAGIPESDTLLRALPAVRAHIAGIWGERDRFAVPFIDERRRVLATFDRDLDFRVVAGAGHWVPYEEPRQVNHMLMEMLR